MIQFNGDGKQTKGRLLHNQSAVIQVPMWILAYVQGSVESIKLQMSILKFSRTSSCVYSQLYAM